MYKYNNDIMYVSRSQLIIYLQIAPCYIFSVGNTEHHCLRFISVKNKAILFFLNRYYSNHVLVCMLLQFILQV